MAVSHSVVVSGYGPTVTTFVLTASGELARTSECTAAGKAPSYLALSPSRSNIYVVNESAAGTVTALAVDPLGALSGLGAACTVASAAGDDPCHVIVHPNGSLVLVSNYSAGGLSVLRLDAGGGFATSEPVDVALPGAHVHHAVITGAGAFVLVAVLGADAVYQYCIDATTGKLTPNPAGERVTLAKGSGPRHICVDEARGRAFVINELDCTLTAFLYDMATGVLLGSGATVSTLPAGVARPPTGWSTAHVVTSPDGGFLYGSNRGHDSIVVWRVHGAGSAGAQSEPPRLEAVEWVYCSGRVRTPRDFAITGDGKWVLVACQATDEVLSFARDSAAGTLTLAGSASVPAGTQPCCVLVLQ